MKIAIRADGNSYIGMGHIMRTLVLAKELAKNNEVFYVCRKGEFKTGIEKINAEGFNVSLVREKYLIEDLKNINADLLITDSYDVDETYFNLTKNIFRKTLYIDDMNLYNFNVDFLLNQNADAQDFHYKVNTDTTLMLGLEFLMLREEFRSIPEKLIKENVCDIMVTVGGGDPEHITEEILNCFRGENYRIHVIVGPSFDNDIQLKNFQSDKIKLYYNANMCEIMKKCDIAISACGSTLYELASCGVPTIGIIIADNQNGISNKLNSMGIIRNLGWYKEINKEKLLKAVNDLSRDYELRQNMSFKASKLIDGKGVYRILAKLLEIS